MGGFMSKIKAIDYLNMTLALLVAIPVKIIVHCFKGLQVFLNEQKEFYLEVIKDYKEI